MPIQPEIAAVEQYLRRLIELTEKGSFAELAERHYNVKHSERKSTETLLRNNRKGHLKMLKWVLSNREKWVALPSLGKVMALMGNSDLEYRDDGLWFRVTEAGAITEPFGDSIVRTRKAEKLKPEIRSGAAQAGISPFVYKEVLRLKAASLRPRLRIRSPPFGRSSGGRTWSSIPPKPMKTP